MGRAAFLAGFIHTVTFNKVSISEEKIQILYFRIRFFFNKQVNNKTGLMVLSKAFGLTGKAIEVGVAEGNFSDFILSKSKFSILYSVDPWQKFNQGYDDANNAPQEEQEKRFMITTERLKKYENRSIVLRMTSQDAARFFDTDTFDFVYIDANHSYDECKKDLNTWWQKLKKGGIFAGHDYLDGKIPLGTFGVKTAINEFAREHRQKIFVTKETWPTWYLIKK